jgi:hypothetical protein
LGNFQLLFLAGSFVLCQIVGQELAHFEAAFAPSDAIFDTLVNSCPRDLAANRFTLTFFYFFSRSPSPTKQPTTTINKKNSFFSTEIRHLL